MHLTISTFQKQSLFDVAMKTFEEGMAERWEGDEALRKAIAWGALSPGSPAYPGLCAGVAAQLRRLADSVEAEAASARSSTSATG